MGAGAKRVLIVDGDADSRAVFRILLQHHGYEVEDVLDGEAALERALTTRVDVVITELTLRLVDGVTLIERLRRDVRTRDICVVVLTARAFPEDRERAWQAGCAQYLTKPIEPKELLRVIEDLTGPISDA